MYLTQSYAIDEIKRDVLNVLAKKVASTLPMVSGAYANAITEASIKAVDNMFIDSKQFLGLTYGYPEDLKPMFIPAIYSSSIVQRSDICLANLNHMIVLTVVEQKADISNQQKMFYSLKTTLPEEYTSKFIEALFRRAMRFEKVIVRRCWSKFHEFENEFLPNEQDTKEYIAWYLKVRDKWNIHLQRMESLRNVWDDQSRLRKVRAIGVVLHMNKLWKSNVKNYTTLYPMKSDATKEEELALYMFKLQDPKSRSKHDFTSEFSYYDEYNEYKHPQYEDFLGEAQWYEKGWDKYFKICSHFNNTAYSEIEKSINFKAVFNKLYKKYKEENTKQFLITYTDPESKLPTNGTYEQLIDRAVMSAQQHLNQLIFESVSQLYAHLGNINSRMQNGGAALAGFNVPGMFQ